MIWFLLGQEDPTEAFNEPMMLATVNECLKMILDLSWPILMAAIASGVAVAVFQAVTQVQEQTLSFVPKIVCTFWAVLKYGENICHEVASFTERCIEMIGHMGPHK